METKVSNLVKDAKNKYPRDSEIKKIYSASLKREVKKADGVKAHMVVEKKKASTNNEEKKPNLTRPSTTKPHPEVPAMSPFEKFDFQAYLENPESVTATLLKDLKCHYGDSFPKEFQWPNRSLPNASKVAMYRKKPQGEGDEIVKRNTAPCTCTLNSEETKEISEPRRAEMTLSRPKFPRPMHRRENAILNAKKETFMPLKIETKLSPKPSKPLPNSSKPKPASINKNLNCKSKAAARISVPQKPLLCNTKGNPGKSEKSIPSSVAVPPPLKMQYNTNFNKPSFDPDYYMSAGLRRKVVRKPSDKLDAPLKPKTKTTNKSEKSFKPFLKA